MSQEAWLAMRVPQPDFWPLSMMCLTGGVFTLNTLWSSPNFVSGEALFAPWNVPLPADPAVLNPAVPLSILWYATAVLLIVLIVRCLISAPWQMRTGPWKPVDTLIGSWHGSRLAMTVPVTIAAGLVFAHEGFYGLITNAENLSVILTATFNQETEVVVAPNLLSSLENLRSFRHFKLPFLGPASLSTCGFNAIVR